MTTNAEPTIIPTLATVGARIRAVRLAAGRSQEFVAAQVGVSRAAVTQWEGGSGLTLHHLLCVANVLEVEPGSLLTGEIKARQVLSMVDAQQLVSAMRQVRDAAAAQGIGLTVEQEAKLVAYIYGVGARQLEPAEVCGLFDLVA